MGRIQRFTFDADEIINVDMSTPGNDTCKVMFFVQGSTDILMSYNESELTYAYITLKSGQTYVFDGPNPFKTNMFFKANGGASVLEVWVAGGGYA
jgi:hypothetical protein